MRDRALLEHVPELVRPARPLLADDMHRLRDEALLTRPLEQEACDGLVEHLVRRRAGLGDEMVSAAEGHRPADRIGSIGVSPGVRRDEERTLGQRMEQARLVDDGVAARAGRRPAGEYQGDVRVLLGEPIEQPYAGVRARDALDPVAAGVALDELSLDPIEDLRVLVDGDDDGERHAATLLDLGLAVGESSSSSRPSDALPDAPFGGGRNHPFRVPSSHGLDETSMWRGWWAASASRGSP